MMVGRLLDLLSGEKLEETQRNMEALIEGTGNLIKEMKELIKALNAHRHVMGELLDAIKEAR